MKRIVATLALVLALGAKAEAAFTHVQQTGRSGISSTSQPLTMAGVTAGNLLVMTIATQSLTAAINVTGISGGATACNGTWTKDYTETVTGSSLIEIWHSIAASTASCTATATVSPAKAVDQYLYEASWTGGGTIGIDSTCSGANNPTPTTSQKCTAAFTTQQANTYAVGHTSCSNACAIAASGEAAGFTSNTTGSTQATGRRAVFTVLTTTDAAWTSAATEVSGTAVIAYCATIGGSCVAAGTPHPGGMMTMGVGDPAGGSR